MSGNMMSTGVTGLILAGGQASRMGGVNKSKQLLKGLPLIEHVVSQLKPQVDQFVISANQDSPFFHSYGVPVIPDTRPGLLGPLAGIEAVLKTIPDIEWLFCCPCDAPFFPTNLVSLLKEKAKKQKNLAAIPSCRNFRQPLHCLVHADLLPSLTVFLNKGHRKVGQWLHECNAIEVSIEAEPTAFANINTLEELDLHNSYV